VRRATNQAAVALVAAAAGCGGSDAPAPQAQPAAQQDPEAQREARERRQVEAEIRAEERRRSKAAAKPEPSSGGRFTGAQAKRYQEDKEICELFPASQVAKEYGLPPGSDPVTIAEAYADGYRPEFQQAALEGCLDGLGS
jgi:hypothetical protein